MTPTVRRFGSVQAVECAYAISQSQRLAGAAASHVFAVCGVAVLLRSLELTRSGAMALWIHENLHTRVAAGRGDSDHEDGVAATEAWRRVARSRAAFGNPGRNRDGGRDVGVHAHTLARCGDQ